MRGAVTLVALGLIAILSVAVWHLVVWQKRRLSRVRLRLAKDLFHRRREWLEAEFLSLASASGKPRSLLWADCEFEDAVAFARDRTSGQLRALVGVTIGFTSPESEDESIYGRSASMTQRAATAVFHFDGQRWMTDGRVVFNLSPQETIRRFRHELELAE
jgi:hypothetical protein